MLNKLTFQGSLEDSRRVGRLSRAIRCCPDTFTRSLGNRKNRRIPSSHPRPLMISKKRFMAFKVCNIAELSTIAHQLKN